MYYEIWYKDSNHNVQETLKKHAGTNLINAMNELEKTISNKTTSEVRIKKFEPSNFRLTPSGYICPECKSPVGKTTYNKPLKCSCGYSGSDENICLLSNKECRHYKSKKNYCMFYGYNICEITCGCSGI